MEGGPQEGGAAGRREQFAEVREAYLNYYGSLVRAEIEQSLANESTRVCHVGCGAMPFSTLVWHRQLGCRIVGIDREGAAVSAAQQVFQSRVSAEPAAYRAERVSFVHGSGESISYDAFDVVLLSSSVIPKSAVLKRIAATAPGHVRVVERAPVGFWRQLCAWDDCDCEPFEILSSRGVGVLELRTLGLRAPM